MLFTRQRTYLAILGLLFATIVGLGILYSANFELSSDSSWGVPVAHAQEDGPLLGPGSYDVTDDEDEGKGASDDESWLERQMKKVFAFLGNAVLTFFGVFLWAAGVFLDQMVSLTVISMGAIIRAIGESLYTAWATLRDIANIGFIFILLTIGIATILQIQGYGMKQLMARLIIVALLINFSFFMVQAVVDVSNILTLYVYEQLKLPSCEGVDKTVLGVPVGGCATGGISTRFMDALWLTTVYDPDPQNPGKVSAGQLLDASKPLAWSQIFITTIVGSILVLLVAFVFVAVGLMLLIRLALLIFLMVISPLAFAASILPQTRSWMSKWVKTLLGQAFFAPLFMLLTWVVITIISSPTFRGSGGALSFGAALNGSETAAAVFINYGVVVTLIIAALVVSKSFADQATATAMGMSQRWAGKFAAGAPAWAWRQTGGRGFYRLAQDKSGELKKTIDKGGIRGALAQMRLGAYQYGARSSGDVRGIPGFKKLGIDAGKPIKGYEAARKAQEKAYQTYAQKTLGKKHAEPFARNVLEKRTLLSTLMGRTAARRSAAKKILEPIADKTEKKALIKRQNMLKRELQEKKDTLKGPVTPNEEATLKRRVEEIEDALLPEIEEGLEALKEKAADRKEASKDLGKKEEKKEGNNDKGH